MFIVEGINKGIFIFEIFLQEKLFILSTRKKKLRQNLKSSLVIIYKNEVFHLLVTQFERNFQHLEF